MNETQIIGLEQQTAAQRKEKVKTWLKDNHNLVLLGILVFSAIILSYYFSITRFQTLWWDEA